MSTKTEATKTPAVSVEIVGDAMTLTFANGEQLAVTPAMFNPDIRAQAMMHGFKQKLVDAAALSRNPDTGRSATADDKFMAVREVYARLIDGHWNKPRDGAGSVKGGLLFAALCRMQPEKPAEAIREWLDGKTDEQKSALRKNPRVAAIIATIQSERAKADDVDTDALLGELGGE